MNKLIELSRDIERSFRGMRLISLMSIVASVIISVGSVTAVLIFAEKQRQQVYVLDQGKSLLLALQTDAIISKELEIKDHVARFHELFFNLSPQAKTINENLDRAFNLADESAYNYSQDLAAKGYYSRIISANMTQQVIVDSVVVSDGIYPYEAKTYARQYVIRESAMTEYSLVSTCRLINTARSEVNPHGLLMEKFTVIENEPIETRKR